MDEDDNNLTPYEELGPTRRLTCGSTPSATSKPSAAIRHLISELGLRYRPSAQADLAAHAAQLALLANDLAHIEPAELAEAIRQHVLQSPFLPKAADLIAIIEKRHGRKNYYGAYTSESGYVYRSSDPSDVMREAERRADWTTYWQAKADLGKKSLTH